MNAISRWVACAALLLLCPWVHAGELSPHLRYPSLDESVSRDDKLHVSVRLAQAPDAKVLAQLQTLGKLRMIDAKPCVVGRILTMHVPRSALESLAALDVVERVEPAKPLLRVTPLNQTAAEIGAYTLFSPPPPETAITGEGVLIADHEAGWDIFHPDFFRPDGGLFDFEDRDGDRKASAGDGVDLDQDGVFEAELSLLDASLHNNYFDDHPSTPANYQPDLDWLYVDANRNGRRDFGSSSGFNDASPAFGEAIFVGDDVNANGRIDLGEKLLRLGSSKVRLIDVEGTLYQRGQNLSQYPIANFDLSHGTGAIGVAAGGWPGLRRFTGVAPAAELLLITRESPVEAIAVARARQADVLFLEWNLIVGVHDGSSDAELAITQAASDGMVILGAAGNLAGSDHVIELSNITTTAQTVRLSTDGLGYYNFREAWFSINWLGGNVLDLEVSAPDGSRASDLAANAYSVHTLAGRTLQVWRDQSSRGTMSLTLLYGNGSSVLPNTTLSFRFRSKQNGVNIPLLRGIVYDDQAGWGRGVAWLDAISEHGTAITPATADKIIAVAAYGGINDLSVYEWGQRGERRSYSGMGPRIDGRAVVDISAPDDPYSPRSDSTSTHGAYQTYGGTSGALPHAAGSAALLRQALPGHPHDAVEALLKSSAGSDQFATALPNEAYGHGKVRPAVALRQSPSPAPRAIRLRLSSSPAVIGRPCIITAEISLAEGSGDTSDVLLAWDANYDRLDDAAPSLGRSLELPALGEQPLRIVARAIDPSGATVRVLLQLVPEASCEFAGCAQGCCLEAGVCGDCPLEELDEPIDTSELEDLSEEQPVELVDDAELDTPTPDEPRVDEADFALEPATPSPRRDASCACELGTTASSKAAVPLLLTAFVALLAFARRRP